MSVVFDRAATFYDRTRGLPAQAEVWLADAVRRNTRMRAGSRVLEAGVGTGRIGLPLARQGYRYIGVDLSAKMMDSLRSKPGGHAIALARADVARLPFAGRSFDAVVAVHVFHLIGEWAAAMDELRRVLRPGGVLLHGRHRRADDSGPAELRGRIDDLAGSFENRRQAGRVTWDEIGPQLAARFGTPQVVDTPSWSRTTTPRTMIGQLQARTWSRTWGLSDTEIEQTARLAADWAVERWGSLDTPLTDEQSFRWDIYTLKDEG